MSHVVVHVCNKDNQSLWKESFIINTSHNHPDTAISGETHTRSRLLKLETKYDVQFLGAWFVGLPSLLNTFLILASIVFIIKVHNAI